jgi:protease II
MLCRQVYQEQVVGWQPDCYTSRLEWAVSDDGTSVPVTLAFRRDLLTWDGSNMAVLHGWVTYSSWRII